MCPARGAKSHFHPQSTEFCAQDLIQVKFTPGPDGGPHEYMDPVTKDGFTNASRLVVLKPTGTWEACGACVGAAAGWTGAC